MISHQDTMHIVTLLGKSLSRRKNSKKRSEIINDLSNYINQSHLTIQPEDIIQHAIDHGYIARKENRLDPNDNRLIITDAGEQLITNNYTNNHSQNFENYKNEVNRIMLDHGELPLYSKKLAYLFHQQMSVSDVYNKYRTDLDYADINPNIPPNELEYHYFLLKQLGYAEPENKLIFHFNPLLFTTFGEHYNDTVSLTIHGIDTPSQLSVFKPYSNKNYRGVRVKNGSFKSTSGFYPLVQPLHSPLQPLCITLMWKVGHINIAHTLNITFKQESNHGHFYSSAQTLNGEPNLPNISLTTYMENKEEWWNGRHYTFNKFANGDIMINEDVELSNFPIQYHIALYADKRHNTWINQQRL